MLQDDLWVEYESGKVPKHQIAITGASSDLYWSPPQCSNQSISEISFAILADLDTKRAFSPKRKAWTLCYGSILQGLPCSALMQSSAVAGVPSGACKGMCWGLRKQ